MILDSFYKLAGALSGFVVIMSIPFKIMWGRLQKLSDRIEEQDRMLHNRYTKDETEGEINKRLIPLEKSLDSVNETLKMLNSSVNTHSELVRGIQMWQQREIGRGERGNGGQDSP